MEKKYKVYVKLNLMSVFFIALSFISITFAWFAYSGLAKVSTDIGVSAWYIQFKQGETDVSDDIVISLDDVYPGMERKSEKVSIENLGDLDADISYDISSVRILDENISVNDLEQLELEDKLAHDYPFHVNINLDKSYAKSKDGTSEFEVSVSWPLDSGDNQKDSDWGKKVFDFMEAEEQKANADASYQKRSPIKLIINLKASQYLETNDVIDKKYILGDVVLFDAVNNKSCDAIGGNCLKTYVIDANNKISNDKVTLLPDLYGTYKTSTYNDYDTTLTNITSGWKATTRALNISDILKIISTDISNTFVKRENLSDAIVGELGYKDRIDTLVADVKNHNGYFTYLNSKFPFLATNKCYWIQEEYDTDNAFALTKEDDNTSKIYKENKTSSCSVVPVIEASKNTL